MAGSPQHGRFGRTASALIVLVLLAGACGGGDADPETGQGASSTTPDSAAGAAAGPVTVVDGDVETVEDLGVVWAEQRANAVAALSTETFGVNTAGVLYGPGQFSVDLKACPEGWSDVAGFDAATIKIGVTVPQSGDQAQFNNLVSGMKAYFDWVNATGGVGGRSIQLVVRDDGYDGAAALAGVDDLMATENPFYVTTIGTPGSLGAYDRLNQDCVPQPFAASSHPALGDPVNHPWTTGLQMSYLTESLLWGNWLKQNVGGEAPVTVGALVIDNDFGQIFADGFNAWAGSNRAIVSQVTIVKHDPTHTTVEAEMAKVADSKPQVFLAMTNGEACASTVAEAGKLGLQDSTIVRFAPSVCTQAAMMTPGGDSADGFYAVGPGLISTTDPAHADDTFVRFTNEQLTVAGLDPTNELAGIGFAQYGWAHTEILRIADALPGGLSRSNVLLALRGADLSHPMVDPGVQFATNGDNDAYFLEGSEYNRYDAKAGAWYPQGTAIDLNGSTPSCGWVRGVCVR